MFIKPITIGSPAISKPPSGEDKPDDGKGRKDDSGKAGLAANEADLANKAPDFDELNEQAAARIIQSGASMRGSLLNVRA